MEQRLKDASLLSFLVRATDPDAYSIASEVRQAAQFCHENKRKGIDLTQSEVKFKKGKSEVGRVLHFLHALRNR